MRKNEKNIKIDKQILLKFLFIFLVTAGAMPILILLLLAFCKFLFAALFLLLLLLVSLGFLFIQGLKARKGTKITKRQKARSTLHGTLHSCGFTLLCGWLAVMSTAQTVHERVQTFFWPCATCRASIGQLLGCEKPLRCHTPPCKTNTHTHTQRHTLICGGVYGYVCKFPQRIKLIRMPPWL